MLKGVDVSSSVPGNSAGTFAAEEEDYLRWLEAIGEMGANTLRVYGLMDADFYNAFYSYNTIHEEPLYLLQGIQVSDLANYGAVDGWDETFYGDLLWNGKAAVDIVHGRKMLSTHEMPDDSHYLKDVSQWVIGYLVGHEWSADTVAYTDHREFYDGIYRGTYFTTAEDATPFEAMLAQVMDAITVYESEKYGAQRVIGFISAPVLDFLEYEEVYARQAGKYAHLDAEHIRPTEELRSGYYAAYLLDDLQKNFTAFLSEEQRDRSAEDLAGLDTSRGFDGYLELVSRHHTMPVIVAGYSVSTARGADKEGVPPLTEEEQGRSLMSVWQEIVDTGWNGMCIAAWQDQWERRSWNTAFATDIYDSSRWHDVQSAGENNGLMSFEEKESVCVLDGSPEEWAGDTPVLETKGVRLSVRSDREGLYLMLQGNLVSPEQTLYLPMDLTEDLGSTRCAQPELTFDRAADFLLCLDGESGSRLLVQERYDAMRENFNYETGGEDPFINFPEKESPDFLMIRMATENASMAELTPEMDAETVRQLRALKSWETGRLVHGNGDPASEQYNSLADFCYGADCVEIRLPWMLLNVADPVDREIHQDYYEHYGVETEVISGFSIGLGDGSSEIALAEVKLDHMSQSVEWTERLKQSYDIIREHWK